jgi:protein-tyrosine phosphatase
MSMKLYWIDGPWAGRLAISSRPRGGDWLGDEILHWKRDGVTTVVSLLTEDEDSDLDLSNEASEVKQSGMSFLRFSIQDRHPPESESAVTSFLEALSRELGSGKNVVIHCRQGIGRSGLMAASLLIMKGLTPGAAIDSVSAARGTEIPETAEQRGWIDRYATLFAGSKSR